VMLLFLRLTAFKIDLAWNQTDSPGVTSPSASTFA
jgi:hypothetical protein